MAKARIFDTIPFFDSGEHNQNSEPSLAVDPLDPTQIIVGAFAGQPQPYFKSTTGGLRGSMTAPFSTTTNRSRGKQMDQGR
jgi:hypothetical protein